MRKIGFVTALLLCLTLAAPSNASLPSQKAYALTNIKVSINGSPFELNSEAYVTNRTTMVPLREVAEALGAKVTWHKDNTGQSKVTLIRGTHYATLTVGSTILVANGSPVKLDIAPLTRGNVTFVPLRALSEALGTIVSWDGINRFVLINDPAQLPVVGNAQKLEELLKQAELSGSYYNRQDVVGIAGNESAVAADNATIAPMSPESKSTGGDYSQTNVQVNGVDEADWVKTDGHYVYQLSQSRVLITDISNSAAPKLAAILDYSAEQGFYPQELYVDQDSLIVIGQNHMVRSSVRTKIYRLDNVGLPRLIRETELEGNYLSSRKIDNGLYVITNKYNYVSNLFVRIKQGGNVTNNSNDRSSEFEPIYQDSVSGNELKTLPLDELRYFPDSPDSSTMLIGALDLDQPAKPMQVSAYLGSGQTIYASKKHLYIAISKNNPSGDVFRQETQIHKFRLDQGSIVYIGESSIPGTILNQFAMDEYEGYFRIATTISNSGASGVGESSNNLYVIDEQMNTIGTLENLAPGERIYSTRFMGGRAYMVTFRKVDPLFAIDLRNPTNPTVLGQLKIPGYSDYLHPYDDHHIIGFGKETVEVPSKGIGPDATMAFYQGMKIALFDVTDVSHPVEKFKEVIGDRGTESELLGNHKALMFSKSKGLLAFPVELMEIKDKTNIDPGGFPAFGQFTYQGAYVYHLDLETGFSLQGRITHLSQDDLLKSSQYGFEYSKSVRRILYSGNTLYTLSESMLKANDLDNLTELGRLTYPAASAMSKTVRQ